jgi:hypothetical protein
MSTIESTQDSRTELRAWYLTRLRPKLSQAVAAGSVASAAALELDRQVFELLDIADDEAQEQAA